MKRFVERGRWKASVSGLIATRTKQDLAGGGFDYADDDHSDDPNFVENFFVANGSEDDASTGGGSVATVHSTNGGSSVSGAVSAIGGCSDGGSAEHALDVWPLELRGRQPTQLLPWRPKRTSRSRQSGNDNGTNGFADGLGYGIADGTDNGDASLSAHDATSAPAEIDASATASTTGSDAYALPIQPPGLRWSLPPFSPPGLPGSPAWPRAVAAESLVYVAPTYRPTLGLPNANNGSSSSSNSVTTQILSSVAEPLSPNLSSSSSSSSSSLIGQSQSRRRGRNDGDNDAHTAASSSSSSSSFSAADLYTTSALLRHPDCRMHTLALVLVYERRVFLNSYFSFCRNI
jgi:hypothetical protein